MTYLVDLIWQRKVFVFLCGVCGGIALSVFASTVAQMTRVSGWQVSSSPDGRYELQVGLPLEPKAGDPMWIKILYLKSGGVAYQARFIEPHTTMQPLRGADRIVRWDEDSEFVDVQMSEKSLLRIKLR